MGKSETLPPPRFTKPEEPFIPYVPDELLKILDDDYQPADAMEAACFDFVRAASTDPSNVPMEIRQRLKKHLTPPQIVELACVVGFWKFYNTVHDSLHIPVEEHLLNDTRYVDA